MNNEIANVGEKVRYNGKIPRKFSYLGLSTINLMESKLIPGKFYEVINVDLNFEGFEGCNWYRFKYVELQNQWVPCCCFDRDYGLVYGLK